MHEYSIVASLVDSVEREAVARGGRVHRLHVAVGELAGVEVPLLRTAYDTFRPHTVCEDAPMEVRMVRAVWRCPACEATLPAGARLRCTACDRPARLACGDEIVLERIELEVPDV